MIRSNFFNLLKKRAERSELECRDTEISLLERNPDAELLDLGCGDGSFTMKAAEKVGTQKVYGVDIVDEDINKAKSRGMDVRRADLNHELPLPKESFDVVIASHVIEHLCETDVFLKEINRKISIGGYLVIATPNLAAWHHIVFLLFGKQPTIAEVSDEALVGTLSPRGNRIDRHGPAHRRIFTMEALRGLLEHHGFKCERIIGAGFFPMTGRFAAVMSRLDVAHATNILVKARKVDLK